MIRYLQLYPVPWPVFSTKYYVQDQDGWWNNLPKKKKAKKHIPVINWGDAGNMVASQQ